MAQSTKLLLVVHLNHRSIGYRSNASNFANRVWASGCNGTSEIQHGIHCFWPTWHGRLHEITNTGPGTGGQIINLVKKLLRCATIQNPFVIYPSRSIHRPNDFLKEVFNWQLHQHVSMANTLSSSTHTPTYNFLPFLLEVSFRFLTPCSPWMQVAILYMCGLVVSTTHVVVSPF